MSTSARRRLVRDFKKMAHDPPQGINAAPLEKCVFSGPTAGAASGGRPDPPAPRRLPSRVTCARSNIMVWQAVIFG